VTTVQELVTDRSLLRDTDRCACKEARHHRQGCHGKAAISRDIFLGENQSCQSLLLVIVNDCKAEWKWNYFMDRTFPHFTPRSTIVLDDVPWRHLWNQGERERARWVCSYRHRWGWKVTGSVRRDRCS